METPILSTQTLGAAVREARKAQGFTQSDLAGMANTGRRLISDVENGKATTQVGKVLHLLKTLGVAMTLVRHW